MFPFPSMVPTARLTAWRFNGADKSANITLSNLDRSMSTVSPDSAVRGTAVKTSGKWYFEVSGGPAFGLSRSSATLNSGLGDAPDTIGYRNNGFVYQNGLAGTLASYVVSDIVMVAFDIGASKVWFGKNGVWDGDPGAGTGGFTLAGMSGGVSPAASSLSVGGADSTIPITYTYSVPVGFQAL